ncbi:hypothetical protein N9023_02100 [Opitutaceae bacterium]|nr:hypothetical protein [Opitutaceae bacterium]
MNSSRASFGLALVLSVAITAASANPILINPQDAAKATKALTKVRQLVKTMEVTKPGAVLAIPEPRQDTDGKYISPYLADGTLAEWARKGMGAAAGVAGTVGGNMLADKAGDKAGAALASKVPGGAALGSLFGRKASKKLTDTATVKAVGGWDFIKSTSDISFNSVMDLAVYMHANHATVDPEYGMALAATMGIHPRLVGAYEPALKRAYSRAEVREVPVPSPTGVPQPTEEQLAELQRTGMKLAEDGADEASTKEAAESIVGTLTGHLDENQQAAAAGFLNSAVEANTMQSSGGTQMASAGMESQVTAEAAPDVPPISLNTAKQFNTKLKFLNRTNRVIVAGFRVGFVVRDSVTASVAAGYQFGGTHTSGARSKTAVELAGVDASTLQNITEQLYADFIADLKAAGREVVTLDEARTSEGFARLDTSPTPYTKESKFLQDRIVSVYTPEGVPLWWEHGNQIGDKGPFATGNWKAAGAMSVDLNAIVVAPTFLISFAELESSGNKRGMFSGYGSGRASTGASPKICLLKGETKMLAIHFKHKIAGDFAAAALKDKVVVGEFGAEMITLDERDNNNASRAGLLGLARTTGSQGLFAAAGAARSEQTLAVQTNPGYFTAYSLAALRGVNDAYIEVFNKYPAKK